LFSPHREANDKKIETDCQLRLLLWNTQVFVFEPSMTEKARWHFYKDWNSCGIEGFNFESFAVTFRVVTQRHASKSFFLVYYMPFTYVIIQSYIQAKLHKNGALINKSRHFAFLFIYLLTQASNTAYMHCIIRNVKGGKTS
jgi:hypothetical protein